MEPKSLPPQMVVKLVAATMDCRRFAMEEIALSRFETKSGRNKRGKVVTALQFLGKKTLHVSTTSHFILAYIHNKSSHAFSHLYYPIIVNILEIIILSGFENLTHGCIWTSRSFSSRTKIRIHHCTNAVERDNGPGQCDQHKKMGRKNQVFQHARNFKGLPAAANRVPIMKKNDIAANKIKYVNNCHSFTPKILK
jgi:hypothetical protein